jgi:hypothetical protein
LAAFWLLMLIPGRDDPDQVRFMLSIYGQVLLPPLMGWIGAGLLLGDPCRELLLTFRRPIWCAVLERLALLEATALATWAALFAAAWALLLSGPWVQAAGDLGGSATRIFLSGMTTPMAFAGLGLWAALRLRSTLAGGLTVAAVWAGGLIFRRPLLSHRLGHIIHPCLLLEAPESPLWLLNGLFLFFVTIVLAMLALRATGNEEVLLASAPAEEAA